MNAGRPPTCSDSGKMSGVFGQRFGRKNSRTGLRFSSLKYLVSSHFVSRHAKYVYDCENPTFANRYMIFGRVNASAKKMTSECSPRTSPITHSQNGNGFVCGLSTRKIRTPLPIQNKKILLSSSQSD